MSDSTMTEANTAICKCQRCKDIKYIFLMDHWQNTVIMMKQPYPVCNAQNIANDQRARAGIPRKYFCTFYPDFKWDSYGKNVAEQKMLVTDFVKSFQKWKDNRMGLHIWSKERGSGKTMLASAVLNSLMLQNGVSARFNECPKLLRHIN